MIKLLVSDLDGTFLMPKPINGKTVSEENYNAMMKFREAGGTFVTASGRHHEFSYTLMEELGFKFDMIGTNGATLIHKNCLVEHNHPERHIVRKVVEELTKPEYGDDLEVLATDLSFTYIFGDPKSWVMDMFIEIQNNGLGASLTEVPLLDWLNDRKRPDITCLSVAVKDPARLDEWIDFLREKFDRYFDIYASSSRFIEMMRPGINKGHGVRSIMALYGLEEHEVAVVGDNQNDISMFFATPNSYCMATAKPAVQKYAHKVVNSVAEVIEDIMRKNEAERISKGGF
ncbi:MAG: HAD family phosphatase [Erysipelotrichaceae bacterium]|nr:HAD family phosphatase [Erysipelotrichaceae bacterium]